MSVIQIRKTPTADSRTCDVTKVSKEQLLEASRQHIEDVRAGLVFFVGMFGQAAATHDWDKVTDDGLERFYRNFQTKFEERDWWDNHRRVNRHHLEMEDGVPPDVNLVDVMEYIVDCVMAGKARSGTVRELKMVPGTLERAFANTVALLDKHVVVVE